MKPSDRHRHRSSEVRDQQGFHVPCEDQQYRQKDLVRNGNDREVFHRVKGRFDQKVDVDSDQKRDDGPSESDDGFGDHRHRAFLIVKP